MKYLYYSIGKSTNYRIGPISMDDRRYLSMYEFTLSDHTNVYKRNVSGVLDILGGTGGVMQILLFVCGYMFRTISEFHFK
jgi:hypothetical protein